MTAKQDIASEVAAIIEAFRAEERAAALAEAKKTRATYTFTLPDNAHLGFETVIDQSAEPEEISGLLETMMRVVKQREAKVLLVAQLKQIQALRREIVQMHKNLAAAQVRYESENATRNENRRVAVAMTPKQAADLQSQRLAIKGREDTIAEHWIEVDELERVIAGQDWIEAVKETEKKRAEAAKAAA